MRKITPFLTFRGNAEEAVALYTSLFENSRVTSTSRYGAGAPLPEGTFMSAEFELDGQRFVALDAGPDFPAFSEGFSLMVPCETQREIDEYTQKLIAGGGAQHQCGWIRDRFGVS